MPQVEVVSDMTLHPVMLALGAPLLRIPCLPLLASANRQNWVGTMPWVATAVALKNCSGLPLSVALPL